MSGITDPSLAYQNRITVGLADVNCKATESIVEYEHNEIVELSGKDNFMHT